MMSMIADDVDRRKVIRGHGVKEDPLGTNNII
jgi:hypothetical protein